jgi:hypothetical protein
MFQALAEARAAEKLGDDCERPSLYSIAHNNHVPYTTLLHYLDIGITDQLPQMGRPTTVPREDEKRFLQFAQDRNRAHAGLTKPRAVRTLQAILDRRNSQDGGQRQFRTPSKEPSKNWWAGLRRRSTEPISFKAPKRQTLATLKALNSKTIGTFYDIAQQDLASIPLRRRYTADEFGISQKDKKSNAKVLWVAGTPACYAAQAQGLPSHVTLMNCVCGDNTAIPTALIFGGRKEDLQLEQLTPSVVKLGYTRKMCVYVITRDMLLDL